MVSGEVCEERAKLMGIKRFDTDRNRWALWPISLRWGAKECSSRPGNTHGWFIDYEAVPSSLTSYGCMPGWRKLYGQTLHVWRLKICFGKVRR